MSFFSLKRERKKFISLCAKHEYFSHNSTLHNTKRHFHLRLEKPTIPTKIHTCTSASNSRYRHKSVELTGQSVDSASPRRNSPGWICGQSQGWECCLWLLSFQTSKQIKNDMSSLIAWQFLSKSYKAIQSCNEELYFCLPLVLWICIVSLQRPTLNKTIFFLCFWHFLWHSLSLMMKDIYKDNYD